VTLSWIFRMVLVWLWVLAHGADPTTCERVWAEDPRSAVPSAKTYEEWYGSPELICDKFDHRYLVAHCIGPNC
jgi:hypothetical protein